MYYDKSRGYRSLRTDGEGLTEQAKEAAKYLIAQVSGNGFISASSDYGWYKPHWFRDSSFIAMSLLGASSIMSSKDAETAASAKDAADRIIRFNIGAAEKYMPSLRSSLDIPFEDINRFKSMDVHMPARVDPNANLFKGRVGNTEIDDTNNDWNKWLIQYDTLPLILLSLERKSMLFGLDINEKDFLSRNAEDIARYLGKAYLTPSSDAWEVDTEYLHSYDIAAIYKAKEILKGFSADGTIGITAANIEHIFNSLYNGGMQQAMRDMVKGGVLYSRRRPFSDPDVAAGVDFEELFIFTRFGITDRELGDGVERRTIEEIERKLFNGHDIAVRNLHDTYFCGGRWLISGYEMAIYMHRLGAHDAAEEKVKRINEKYSEGMPEQVIEDPATGIDEGNYLALNGGRPIQRLNWSYASMIDSVVELNDVFGCPAASPTIGKYRRFKRYS
ncbi:MAG: hypothetical protein QXJ35_02865 [Candidatus Micrarchaeaceae archaeon]|nr:hypothetical protein [Candidatus Marsarchaeota archaeon]